MNEICNLLKGHHSLIGYCERDKLSSGNKFSVPFIVDFKMLYNISLLWFSSGLNYFFCKYSQFFMLL